MTKSRKPAPPQRRPSRKNTRADDSSRIHRPEDGHQAPTREDRLDAQVIADAKARGYRIAVRCTRCNQWVVADASVAAHMGPVCRSKVVAE